MSRGKKHKKTQRIENEISVECKQYLGVPSDITRLISEISENTMVSRLEIEAEMRRRDMSIKNLGFDLRDAYDRGHLVRVFFNNEELFFVPEYAEEPNSDWISKELKDRLTSTDVKIIEEIIDFGKPIISKYDYPSLGYERRDSLENALERLHDKGILVRRGEEFGLKYKIIEMLFGRWKTEDYLGGEVYDSFVDEITSIEFLKKALEKRPDSRLSRSDFKQLSEVCVELSDRTILRCLREAIEQGLITRIREGRAVTFDKYELSYIKELETDLAESLGGGPVPKRESLGDIFQKFEIDNYHSFFDIVTSERFREEMERYPYGLRIRDFRILCGDRVSPATVSRWVRKSVDKKVFDKEGVTSDRRYFLTESIEDILEDEYSPTAKEVFLEKISRLKPGRLYSKVEIMDITETEAVHQNVSLWLKLLEEMDKIEMVGVGPKTRYRLVTEEQPKKDYSTFRAIVLSSEFQDKTRGKRLKRTDFEELTGIKRSQSSMSGWLRKLVDEGIIEQHGRKRGTWYSIEDYKQVQEEIDEDEMVDESEIKISGRSISKEVPIPIEKIVSIYDVECRRFKSSSEFEDHFIEIMEDKTELTGERKRGLELISRGLFEWNRGIAGVVSYLLEHSYKGICMKREDREKKCSGIEGIIDDVRRHNQWVFFRMNPDSVYEFKWKLLRSVGASVAKRDNLEEKYRKAMRDFRFGYE